MLLGGKRKSEPFFAEEAGADVPFVTFGEVALIMTGSEPVGLDTGWPQTNQH